MNACTGSLIFEELLRADHVLTPPPQAAGDTANSPAAGDDGALFLPCLNLAALQASPVCD